MSYFGFTNYVSPPKSPVEGRRSPIRSPIIPFKTSPSQLNEVSTCPDFTFSNSLRSPEGPMRGRSVKEFEEQLSALKKENFNLKIRIYFLEERMGANFNMDKENILKNNVELMVEIESLKKELQEKHELLCQAVKAMDLEEDEFKKNAHAKNEEIMALRQEIEELKLQLQDGKYETDSSHKSYHSEPLFYTSKIGSITESNSKMRMLQERIESLENELIQEKENSASLQMIMDQAYVMNTKYDELQAESTKKDEAINSLKEELKSANESFGKFSAQIKELERDRDNFKLESQKLSRLLLEKSKAAEEAEELIAEIKRKYANLKVEYESVRQKSERSKFVADMKASELEEELERQKNRVQDLQKKLGSTNQELKENQNLLVPKSRVGRSISTNTDCDNVSVSNTATSPGVSQENALCNALDSRSPSKSPVTSKTLEFDSIYKILNTTTFEKKSQVMKRLEVLKNALNVAEQKIVRLKAQEQKACAIIKNLMQYHKSAEEQNQSHQKRIKQLEKELESVVSKPEGGQSSSIKKEKVDNSRDENEFKALVQGLENKIQVLELTLKEKDIHIEYIEARNLELQNNIQTKEKDLIDLENSMSSQTLGTEKSREAAENTYSKLFEEKNQEIERLNDELRKRTQDLQSVVNQELWQKNREIEKLQIKFTQLLENKEKEMVELKESFSILSANLNELRTENEEKHVENTNLKIDISDLNLQLQLLREKISEIGLISDDKLEVEIIISSLDEMKNIQQQLEDLKLEKDIQTKKISELEGAIQIYEESPHPLTQEVEIEKLKENLKISEGLRMQTTEVCYILRRQLEDLAVFLDSLMKQKSVLGFLGSYQNKKLKEAIEQSLDLSKSLNMSLSMNPEQSLMQLTNITSLLNCSDISNITMTEDSNRYSFSIMPDQAALTYQSHLFRVQNETQDQNKSFIVKALEDQIEMLQRELSIKNSELNRFRRDSRNGKDSRLSHCKRISPSKLKNAVTFRKDQNDSESEAWSEPDVNVSKARIGLFKDNKSIVGVEEIQSSDSTDESLTQLDYKRADILNECQVTITKLSKQVQDLQAKLQEKESHLIELQETTETSNSLKEENNLLINQVEKLEKQLEEARSELIQANSCKNEIEREIEYLKDQIRELESSKDELVNSHNIKDKELNDKINKMKVEREQLVNMATEYAKMTESSRQAVIQLEDKLTQLSIEKENMEVDMKKEYENNLMKEVKTIEKQLTEKMRETEMKAIEQINEMTKKIAELTENYTENYVRKSEIVQKINEIEALNLELEMLRESLDETKKAAEQSEILGKAMKEEINVSQMKLGQVESQLSTVVYEKEKLVKELEEVAQKNTKLRETNDDIQQELLLMKENHEREIDILHTYKSKLDLKVSELEFNNADLHNRLVKLQSEIKDQSRTTPPPACSSQFVDVNRSIPINQVSPYSRQISNNSQFSQSYVSEDEVKPRSVFSIVVPQQKSVDSERIESNASPDLGIESDQGRFSSLEVQAQVSRPLQQTIEIAESMNNLLDDNNSLPGSTCDNKSCYEKSLELTQENNNLKKKLLKTRKALEDTVTQLTLANQRKKLVEKNICRQIHKTSQVLREAKANLDSGSETDFHKK